MKVIILLTNHCFWRNLFHYHLMRLLPPKTKYEKLSCVKWNLLHTPFSQEQTLSSILVSSFCSGKSGPSPGYPLQGQPQLLHQEILSFTIQAGHISF